MRASSPTEVRGALEALDCFLELAAAGPLDLRFLHDEGGPSPLEDLSPTCGRACLQEVAPHGALALLDRLEATAPHAKHPDFQSLLCLGRARLSRPLPHGGQEDVLHLRSLIDGACGGSRCNRPPWILDALADSGREGLAPLIAEQAMPCRPASQRRERVAVLLRRHAAAAGGTDGLARALHDADFRLSRWAAERLLERSDAESLEAMISAENESRRQLRRAVADANPETLASFWDRTSSFRPVLAVGLRGLEDFSRLVPLNGLEPPDGVSVRDWNHAIRIYLDPQCYRPPAWHRAAH